METKDHEATHSPQQSIQLSSSTVQQDQNQKGLPLQQQQQQEDEQQPQKYQTDNIRVPSQLPSNYDFTTTTETISNSYVMPLSNTQNNSQYQKQHFSTDPVPSPVPHQFSYPGSAVSQAPPQSSAPPSQSHSIPLYHQYFGQSLPNDQLQLHSSVHEPRNTHLSLNSTRPYYSSISQPQPPPPPPPAPQRLPSLPTYSMPETESQQQHYVWSTQDSQSHHHQVPPSAITTDSSTASTTTRNTMPFQVSTNIDINRFPDVTSLVNSNANIVVPLVESRFVDAKICTICGKRITRDMSRHLRTHQVEARFHCVFPKRQCRHKLGKFNRPYDFKKHLLNRHFIFDDSAIKRLHNLSDKLDHWGMCPCGLRFTGKDWLNDHILTNDRTKKCRLVE